MIAEALASAAMAIHDHGSARLVERDQPAFREDVRRPEAACTPLLVSLQIKPDNDAGARRSWLTLVVGVSEDDAIAGDVN